MAQKPSDIKLTFLHIKLFYEYSLQKPPLSQIEFAC